MSIRNLACACLLWLALPALAQSGPDALFKAAESGNVADIREALAQGVSVNVADPAGWTPLLVAAGEGQLVAVQALVKAGANVNGASKKGETPLMAAVLSGNVAVVKYLLAAGADKTAVTAKGLTATDIAEQAKKPEIAKLLAPTGGNAPAAVKASSKKVGAKEVAAVEAYQKGRYGEAAGLFRELVRLDPRHALAWHFLGQSLAKTGDFEEARKAFERSLEIEPRGDIADRTRSLMAMPLKDCEDCPEMVMIPAGSFEMGEAGSTHRVTIKSFAIGKTEVTQAQWQALMGSNPSEFRQCGGACPVEKVSWDDIQEFIRRLNAKTGKTYRLPSEAEWEYACRAGRRHEYCGSESVDSVAWYTSNSGDKTHAVAGRLANAWGLHDMSGNVWEWTQDCWNNNFSGAPAEGTAWTSGDCAKRVRRGGSSYNPPRFASATNRSWDDTAVRNNFNGFRLARMLP
jgi:formylglycine-generating enzyme required for sulfatase activity